MPLSGGAAPAISIKKQQTTTTPADESPFPVMYLAGLYDAAINDATGETTYNVVVLTCGPSKGQAHTRSELRRSRQTLFLIRRFSLRLLLFALQRWPRFTLACL